MKSHCLKACFLALILSLPLTSYPRSYPDSFDPYLRESATRYMGVDWRWLKAQCYQESLLNPYAVSHAGAMGLCQFMPATWAEVTAQMGIQASVWNPKANSLAAGFYMARLLRFWTSPRTPENHLRWAQSSYNAGPGTVLKAQKRAGGSLEWCEIEHELPQETRTYVRRIERWFRDMT